MIGIALAAISGIIFGSFYLPMGRTVRWKWETTWSIWSIWALLVLPWVGSFITVPNLMQVYYSSDFKTIGLVFIFGFLWGISTIAIIKGLVHLGLSHIGTGLCFSILIGLVLVIGMLQPFVTSHPEEFLKFNRLMVIAGVLVMLLGIILSAWSGVLKQHDLNKGSANNWQPERSISKGILFCVITIFVVPMLNYAFIYGEPLRSKAQSFGASAMAAPNVVWCIALLGGFVSNISFCLWLTRKNNDWFLYLQKDTRIYYVYAMIMAILWVGGLVVYGIAATKMGRIGPSVGWAVSSGVSIVTANLLGIFNGEWNGSSSKTRTAMGAGLIVLIGGVCLVGWANSL